MILGSTLRMSVAAPAGQVAARIRPHVVTDGRASVEAAAPHYRGEVHDDRFALVTPPHFGLLGPRSYRLPISIVGTLSGTADETLAEARIGLTSGAWWFVIGFSLGMPLLVSALLYPIHPLDRGLFYELVGIATGVAAVSCLVSGLLALSLGTMEFRNVLQGHARW